MKIHGFPSNLIDFRGKSMKNHGFSLRISICVLGNLGVDLNPPPKLCTANSTGLVCASMSWCVRGGDRAGAVKPLGRRRAQELALELRRRSRQRFQELRRNLGPQSVLLQTPKKAFKTLLSTNHRKYHQRRYELPKTLLKYSVVHDDGTNCSE